MRDPGSGRSLHDRDADHATETRQMGESDRRAPQERAAPYVLAVAIAFAVIVGLLFLLR